MIESRYQAVFFCAMIVSKLEKFQADCYCRFHHGAEYIATSKAVKDAFWFKKFIAKLDVMPLDNISLYYNNNGAVVLAKEPRSYQKFKHIERWFHFIRDYLKKRYIEVKRVDSTDNVANPLMKQLSQQKTATHLKKMELRFVAN